MHSLKTMFPSEEEKGLKRMNVFKKKKKKDLERSVHNQESSSSNSVDGLR